MRVILFSLILLIGAVSCRTVRDTEGWDIKSKYNSDNKIYKTNSKFIYSVYRTKGNDTLDSYVVNHLNDTLSVSTVVLTVLPGKFFGQTKIKWEYMGIGDSVVTKEITGVVEDKEVLWLHPPRSGYPFRYTESAAFPEIAFPLKKGKQWKGGLSVLSGYKDIGLKGKVKNQYTVIGKDEIDSEYRSFGDCWEIKSTSVSNIGSSAHKYYFDQEFGFVYSEYSFPTGERLVITLKDYKIQE